jgi:hypothetical protein
LNKIKEEYELCINKSNEYKKGVDSVSNLLGLKGKYKLISDHCPAYFIGNYNQANMIFFGLNPILSHTNLPNLFRISFHLPEHFVTPVLL